MSTSPARSAAAANASLADKVAALRVETKLKHQAIRDTQVRNHYLHKQVSELHGQLEQADREAKTEEELIERLKRRLNIDNRANQNDKSVASMLRDHEQLVHDAKKTPLRIAGTAFDENNDSVGDDDADDDETRRHRRTSVAVLERHGIPVGKPVPLVTLEDVAQGLERELTAAREQRSVVVTAAQRLSDRKASLEDDIRKQLARNERLNAELAKCKKIIQKNASIARDENTAVIQLERRLRALQDSCSRLRSEARSQEKHNQRLVDKLSTYANEMRSMQLQRQSVKGKALDEASVAEERERWIAELRDENNKLVDYLLNEQRELEMEDRGGDGVAAASERNDFDALAELVKDREARRTPQREQQLRQQRHQRPLDAFEVQRRATEQRLLSELNQMIKETQVTATSAKEHANRLLRGY